MALSVQYDRERRFVLVEVTSLIDTAVATSIAREVVSLGAIHDCKNFLLDFRKTAIVEGTMEIYNFANSLPDLGLGRDVRIASIISGEDPDHRFYETVARNLGFDVRYFTDREQAERWLAEQPSTSKTGPG